jgi:hypothetical protein
VLAAEKTFLAVGIAVLAGWLAIAGAEGRGRGQGEVSPIHGLGEGNGGVSH